MSELASVQMDFIDRLREVAGRFRQLKQQGAQLATEEATKMALVVPFIQRVLGYDVSDPREVVPEFTADFGTKKGAKVDYAILHGGKPAILFECKQADVDLSSEQASQLFGYFAATDAHIGVLTNGIQYRVFSDLEKPNKMDDKPFFEFNLLDFDETLAVELKKFSKASFHIESILATANELKYTREIKRLLLDEFARPSDEFVRFFGKQVYSGSLTQNRLLQFREVTRSAFQQLVNDRINERLKSALASEHPTPTPTKDAQPEPAEPTEPQERSRVETTTEELEAFYVVKAILCEVVDPKRIARRDAQSYFSILLDDSNRKPICRLYFTPTRKYLGLFDEQRNERPNEQRAQIEDINDIYKFADRLKATVSHYEPVQAPKNS